MGSSPPFPSSFLAPVPRILCKNGGGDGSTLFPVWQGTQLTQHPRGQACHPLGGGQVLQETSNWEHGLGSACHRNSAEKQLLEEYHIGVPPMHLSSTAGWGKGCFLSCAAPRQIASPFPCAQGPTGLVTSPPCFSASLKAGGYPRSKSQPDSLEMLLYEIAWPIALLTLCAHVCRDMPHWPHKFAQDRLSSASASWQAAAAA